MRAGLLIALSVVAATAASPAAMAAGRGPEPASRAASGGTFAATTSGSPAGLRGVLASAMRRAGPATGALVVDVTSGRTLFALRPDTPRTPMSNTKLFSTAAILGRFGSDGRLSTAVLGAGQLRGTTWEGDLHLRGGGDPSFGTAGIADRRFGGATFQQLAAGVRAAGVTAVTGRVLGDESRFDTRRAAIRPFFLGVDAPPLSALAFDRNEAVPDIVGRPATLAAQRLRAALVAAGVAVSGAAGEGPAPPGALPLAGAASPPMAALVALVNKPSDNFFAEMLTKALGASLSGRGTTAAGAAGVLAYARRLGIAPRLLDGSGANLANRASPRQIVRLLVRMRSQPEFGPWLASLPVAGVDGTLATRLRAAPARGNCQAKTGTHFVDAARTRGPNSNLSGYCRTRGGHLVAFSILMNGQTVIARARGLQDRMVQAIAGQS